MEQDSRQFTTGEAAKLLAVEPDTVLKWIKSGKLAALRTAGGHHRIDSREVDRLLTQRTGAAPAGPATGGPPRALRCWEYLDNAREVRDKCRDCVVYRVRAAFCFELLKLAEELGHVRPFCPTSCQDCGYYQRVAAAKTRVLLITEDADLLKRAGERTADSIELRSVAGAYCASAMIEGFRPAFAVVDQQTTGKGWRDLVRRLSEDARTPGLKVILAVPQSALRIALSRPQGVAGVLGKPFGMDELQAAIAAVPVERQPGAGTGG